MTVYTVNSLYITIGWTALWALWYLRQQTREREFGYAAFFYLPFAAGMIGLGWAVYFMLVRL